MDASKRRLMTNTEKRSLRIALVGPAPPLRGGIAQYSASLYAALCKQHSPLMIGFRRQYPAWLLPAKRQEDRRQSALRVPSEPLLDPFRPRSWRESARRLAAFDPDAVVMQWWHPLFSFCYAGLMRSFRRLHPAPLILICHNVYSHERDHFLGGRLIERPLVRRVFRRADGFVVQSRSLVPLIREFNADAPVGHALHPIYDFFSQWDHPRAAPEGPRRILFFGNVRPYKGLDILIEALGKIRDRLDFRVVVAGEFFIDVKKFRKMVRENGIADRVDWHEGYVDNSSVAGIFRGADVVVLPYRNASQSGIVPLAYQFEVPVIASDVGGLSEVVRHRKTGLLVPPGDPTALADAIVDFFSQGLEGDPRDEMRKLRRHLSWERVVDTIHDVLIQAGKLGRGARVQHPFVNGEEEV